MGVDCFRSQFFMATPTAIKRLTSDYKRLLKDPVPYIKAAPLESNILEWRYCVKGPEDTPYQGGYYHGKLVFPPDYPFKPPRIMMITPNGRFTTNRRLCLSISDFHPDTWNPAWSVATILTGLLSFMVETQPTVGSIVTSDHEKRQLAINSWSFNLNDRIFNKIFPELVEEISKKLEEQKILEEKELERQEQYMNNVQHHHEDQNYWISTAVSFLWNIAPFVLFASFLYVVQFVIKLS